MQEVFELLNRYLALGFCLHGSRKRISLLELRQAKCNSGRTPNCQNAVYADRNDVRIPCVMAMFAPLDPSKGHRNSYGVTNGKMTVTGENVTFKPGYVHVLPSKTFRWFEEEFISFEPVVPAGVVLVTPEIVSLFPDTEIQIPY